MMLSGIPPAQKKAIKLMVHKMGGRVSNQWTDTATHLIIPRDTVITLKLISPVINTNTTIYFYSWRQHIVQQSPPFDTDRVRRQLFRRRLLIFMDSKLLRNHTSIIEKCGGMAALCGTPSKWNRSENECPHRPRACTSGQRVQSLSLSLDRRRASTQRQPR